LRRADPRRKNLNQFPYKIHNSRVDFEWEKPREPNFSRHRKNKKKKEEKETKNLVVVMMLMMMARKIFYCHKLACHK
jgi:hypothetical protein